MAVISTELIPDLENWTIVILGNWNVSIFSPKWLGENLFPGENIIIEFPVEPGSPARIVASGVRIIPSETRLILNPETVYDQNLTKMEKIASKLLNILQHTPITRTGINFSYKVENISNGLIKHFELSDKNLFADNGMKILTWSVKRTIDYKDYVLNFTTSIDQSTAMFHFNFHFATAKAEIASAAIKDKILVLKGEAERILTDFYKLERTTE